MLITDLKERHLKKGYYRFLSIVIESRDKDEEKVDLVKKVIDENFNLSPRGIREMLSLNKPIYEKTAAYGHFGRTPENKDRKSVV